MTTTSASTALNNQLILKTILDELPMQDLLRCSRVCSAWKDMIAMSSSLQRTLFMKPSIENKTVLVLDDTNNNVKCKCHATLLHPPDSINTACELPLYQLHPLLTAPNKRVRHRFFCSHLLDSHSRTPLDATTTSWSKMYICQPPVKIMSVRTVYDRGNMRSWTVENQAGLTWHDLAESVPVATPTPRWGLLNISIGQAYLPHNGQRFAQRLKRNCHYCGRSYAGQRLSITPLSDGITRADPEAS